MYSDKSDCRLGRKVVNKHELWIAKRLSGEEYWMSCQKRFVFDWILRDMHFSSVYFFMSVLFASDPQSSELLSYVETFHALLQPLMGCRGKLLNPLFKRIGLHCSLSNFLFFFLTCNKYIFLRFDPNKQRKRAKSKWGKEKGVLGSGTKLHGANWSCAVCAARDWWLQIP